MSNLTLHNYVGTQWRATAGQARGGGSAGGAGCQRTGWTCGRGGGRLFGRPTESRFGLEKVGLGGVTPRRA
jgi:hypothetical protein